MVKTSIFQLALEQTTTITTAYEQFVIFSEAACHVNNSRKLSSPTLISTSLASSAGIADIISSPDFLLILDCRLLIL